MADNKIFFTVAEVAERWHISRRQVYRLIELGEILSVNFSSKADGGKGVRIHISEILKHEGEKNDKLS